VDTKKLTTACLEVLDHHASELVIWVDHFVIDVDKISRGSKEVHRPAKNFTSVFGPHVDE